MDETKNFIVIPTIGALVDGYILIVSKKHYSSMLELDYNLRLEYLSIINKYREIFKITYNEYPIIFEHGTNKESNTASSIIHSHTHVVNHNYISESRLIKELNFIDFNILSYNSKNDKSYIMYISPSNKTYISYDFNCKSQLMRYYIAKDLNLVNMYDWKNYSFEENIKSTIKKIKTIE